MRACEMLLNEAFFFNNQKLSVFMKKEKISSFSQNHASAILGKIKVESFVTKTKSIYTKSFIENSHSLSGVPIRKVFFCARVMDQFFFSCILCRP